MVLLKEFFQKVNFEKNQQVAKSMQNYPACKFLISGGNWPTTVALWFVDVITWKSCDGAEGSCYSADDIHVSVKYTNEHQSLCLVVPAYVVGVNLG